MAAEISPLFSPRRRFPLAAYKNVARVFLLRFAKPPLAVKNAVTLRSPLPPFTFQPPLPASRRAILLRRIAAAANSSPGRPPLLPTAEHCCCRLSRARAAAFFLFSFRPLLRLPLLFGELTPSSLLPLGVTRCWSLVHRARCAAACLAKAGRRLPARPWPLLGSAIPPTPLVWLDGGTHGAMLPQPVIWGGFPMDRRADGVPISVTIQGLISTDV